MWSQRCFYTWSREKLKKFLKYIRAIRAFWLSCNLVCSRMLLAAEKKKKNQSGFTRLHSAWRKWTSETHADYFGPYCSRFQQHHNQSWQPTSPQYKLTSHQQGARIAFSMTGQRWRKGSVYFSLHRHFHGNPEAPSFSQYPFPVVLYICSINVTVVQSFLTPNIITQVSQLRVAAHRWGAFRTF